MRRRYGLVQAKTPPELGIDSKARASWKETGACFGIRVRPQRFIIAENSNAHDGKASQITMKWSGGAASRLASGALFRGIANIPGRRACDGESHRGCKLRSTAQAIPAPGRVRKCCDSGGKAHKK